MVTKEILQDHLEVYCLDKIGRFILGKLSHDVNPQIKGMSVSDYAQDGLTKLVCHVTMNKVYKFEDDEN